MKTFQQWIAASFRFSRSESTLPFISQKRLGSPDPHNKYPKASKQFAIHKTQLVLINTSRLDLETVGDLLFISFSLVSSVRYQVDSFIGR